MHLARNWSTHCYVSVTTCGGPGKTKHDTTQFLSLNSYILEGERALPAACLNELHITRSHLG